MTAVSPAHSALPILEAQDLAVHYSGVKAVDGLAIALQAGSIHGLIGPNGSGKSTLVAAITRHVDLTRGKLLFEGVPYQRLAPPKVAGLGVARTFQTVRLLMELSVLENIMIAADRSAGRAGLTWTRLGPDKAAKAAAGERVEDAIARTGVGPFLRMRPSELPYGTQRRVEIARAIAQNPKLLLLDEPTAGMNNLEREEISELMRRLRSDGLTQLLVEHDVQMMLDTCDHVFAMSFGVLIAEGAPHQVVQHDAVREAYLGKRWRLDA